MYPKIYPAYHRHLQLQTSKLIAAMKIGNYDIEEHLNPQQEYIISEETYRFFRKLEGDCRISSHRFLKVNHLKILILGLPCALSFIGLIFLYQFVNLRVHLIFSQLNPSQKHQASHILVKSKSITTICRVKRKQWKAKNVLLFCFQELIYQIQEERVLPLGIKIKEEIKKYMDEGFLSTGLTEEEAQSRLQLYGRNEHLVKVPTYFEYMFEIFFLQPFSYTQYLYFVIMLFLNMPLYGVILIVTSFITSTINYIFIRISYLNIKKIAEKKHEVEVLRQGSWRIIESTLLVPGDIFKPNQQIVCDAIVIKQELFVSEVSFTGQSIPIGKFAIFDQKATYQNLHWVYEGSQIVSKKENCLALVVNTGYSTRKGRVIRKILNPKEESRQFFKNIMHFSFIIILVSSCAFFALFHYMFDGSLADTSTKILIFGIIFLQSLPAFIPVFINMAYTIFLLRLKRQNIFGLNRVKTIDSSRLETICFDKTGTLTENQMEIKDVLFHNRFTHVLQKISPLQLAQHSVLHRLFACCHTVQQQNGKLHGDQIDLRMFEVAKVILNYNHLNEGTVFQVKQVDNQSGFCMQVLKVHQFESKYQSMSVIARDKVSRQTFVFVKGSPQKLHTFSTEKLPNFPEIMRKISLEGFRSIAVSVKKIQSLQYGLYDREKSLQDICLLAIVTFANSLKSDAISTISTLHGANVKTKMITGDNIYVAIQTALSLEMVPQGSRLIALQGSRLRADGGLTAIAVHKDGATIIEEEIYFPQLVIKFFQGQYLAMDFDFIKQRQDFFLQSNVTVFARAPPQAKAVIVKKEKERIRTKYQQHSRWSRIFGGRIHKMGMVGDGANDLMAIRQADVGIGMSNSDAVFSSDFTVVSLSQLDVILRQGRAAQTKMMEIVGLVQICSFVDNVATFLIIHDMALIGPIVLIKDICTFYPAGLILSFTPPADILSSHFPYFNFIGLEFMLRWWGTAFISSAGMSFAITYYKNSPDFLPNPTPDQINGNSKSGTIAFLSEFLVVIMIIFASVGSAPFKKRFYHNPLLFGQLIFGFILITFIYGFTQQLNFLSIQPIALEQAIKVYSICICTGIAINIYNWLIKRLKLYETQDPKRQAGFGKLKELTHSI